MVAIRASVRDDEEDAAAVPVAYSSFEDYALLEEGSAREFIAEELLRPQEECGAWVQCRVLRGPHKSDFRLVAEGTERFLLRATRVGNRFSISTYDDPATTPKTARRWLRMGELMMLEGASSQDPHGPCAAVLEPGVPGSRVAPCSKLFLCSGGGAAVDDARGPLVTVWPSSSWSKDQNAEVRRLRVALPTTSRGARENKAHYVHDLAPRTPFRKIGNRAHEDHRARAPAGKDQDIFLANKVPTWSANLGCLSLSFARRRVRCASSKNFLVYTQDALEDPERRGAADNAIFQLGKHEKRTFALDFKHPLSTLQAFAIALAAFNTDNPRK